MFTRKTLSTCVLAASLGVSSTAIAGGFQLFENNAVYPSNLGAGVGAEAFDVSTGIANPASLVFVDAIKNGQIQAVGAGTIVITHNKFSGTQTVSTGASALLPPLSQTFVADGTRGGDGFFIPAFHVAAPVNERVALGFAVTAPFGLETNYDEASNVRYAATRSKIETIDFSPMISIKINENVSVGAGFNAQFASVDFDSVAGLPTLGGAIGGDPRRFDAPFRNNGHSWGYGGHAGILVSLNEDKTRLGLQYRSRIKHTFEGASTLGYELFGVNDFIGAAAMIPPAFVPPNPGTQLNPITATATFPDTISVHGHHEINEDFSVQASVFWTKWDELQELVIQDASVAATMPPSPFLMPATADVTSDFNWKNTWRVSLGGKYNVNERFSIRAGGTYDQSPTNDVDRSVRLPEVNRWALGTGVHVKAADNIAFDIGYAHFFSTKKAPINNTIATGTQTITTVGTNNGYADILGVGVVVNLT